ncbi:hypothetical protein D3C71_1883490 [compost metagenome]
MGILICVEQCSNRLRLVTLLRAYLTCVELASQEVHILLRGSDDLINRLIQHLNTVLGVLKGLVLNFRTGGLKRDDAEANRGKQ